MIPLCLLPFLACCATGPKPAELYRQGAAPFGALESGGSAYIQVDRSLARPILGFLDPEAIGGAQAEQILDLISGAALGLYPEGQERRFMAAAGGKFPAAGVNFSLAFSREWKKQNSHSGNSYWRSAGRNLSLALYENLALISDGDPFPVFPFLDSPPEFTELSQGAAVTVLLPEGSGNINGMFSSLGLPVRYPGDRMVLALYPAPGPFYQGVFCLHFPTPSQAAAIKAILGLARLQSALVGSLPFGEILIILLESTVETKGNFLIFKTKALESEKIALLLQNFLLL